MNLIPPSQPASRPKTTGDAGEDKNVERALTRDAGAAELELKIQQFNEAARKHFGKSEDAAAIA